MREMWKDINGYDVLYQVSNYGRVWSNKTNRIMKHHNDHLGYARLILRKNNQSFSHYVHRLVAEAFLINKNEFPCVNHIDEDPKNNRSDNLEWCTHQYNSTYGITRERCKANTDYKSIGLKNSKTVLQFDTEGNFIKHWLSANECARVLGYDNSNIAKCCRSELKTAYGFVWKYLNTQQYTEVV
ncbi:NUMOD4 domain-containing protein [Virgibacillus salexigens]|uniref:NUMOD4 domain-containing protein n=1 Tax=Virgibacillus salexigens TaxID=61016 RepID=UPI00308159E2